MKISILKSFFEDLTLDIKEMKMFKLLREIKKLLKEIRDELKNNKPTRIS